MDFWQAWFEREGGRWADDYRKRLEADAPIDDPLVTARLAKLEQREVSILDVGAGPITKLGTSYPGKAVSVVAVDPLADQYARLLRNHGIDPPVRTIKCHGERLLKRFAPHTFDIAFAVNSVDHSYDPIRIIRNMVAVVKPVGVVLLRHVRNEGERQAYYGPHQWNFDVEEGRLVLWNARGRTNVGDELEPGARVEAWIEGDQALARIYPGSRSRSARS
jgi:SAM-dependent methyltransferase